MPPLVTAIIVTYHSRLTVDLALQALHGAVEEGLAACVVVDNASRDGTANYVAANYSWATLVRSPTNVGYGRGCNLGVEHAESPYIFILNPDAAADRHAIHALVEFMQRNRRCGIAAPSILESGSRFQAAGLMTTPMTILRAALGSARAYTKRREIRPDEAPFPTEWVCGAAMLIRTELFRSLGGFDPRFFLYFEETDLCRRAASAGAEVWAVGAASITHVGGASAEAAGQGCVGSCIADHFYPSRYYYLSKHYGRCVATATELVEAIILRARTVIRLALHGRDSRRPVLLRPRLFQMPVKRADQA